MGRGLWRARSGLDTRDLDGRASFTSGHRPGPVAPVSELAWDRSRVGERQPTRPVRTAWPCTRRPGSSRPPRGARRPLLGRGHSNADTRRKEGGTGGGVLGCSSPVLRRHRPPGCGAVRSRDVHRVPRQRRVGSRGELSPLQTHADRQFGAQLERGGLGEDPGSASGGSGLLGSRGAGLVPSPQDERAPEGRPPRGLHLAAWAPRLRATLLLSRGAGGRQFWNWISRAWTPARGPAAPPSSPSPFSVACCPQPVGAPPTWP